MSSTLKAPFPWFGGKSRVAHIVWERFGDDIPNYVEPFFGSGAVLLGRPGGAGRVETVNDKDGHVANFWRAVKSDPEAVAHYADWPVTECDLEARRAKIFETNECRERIERLYNDPDYYDVEIAGIWVWGVCATIGNAWKPRSLHLGAGMGIHKPGLHLGDAGRGIHKPGLHLGNAGRGGVLGWFGELQDRLKRVRVKCGDWTGVTSPTVTTHNGITAVFLDPPYTSGCIQDAYSHNLPVAHDVREWAIAHGDDPRYRIALCGYEGEHEMPDNWECFAWKTAGGYGSQANKRGRENATRERIWFSPHCLSVAKQTELALS